MKGVNNRRVQEFSTMRAIAKRICATAGITCAVALLAANLVAAPGTITTSINSTGAFTLGATFSATFAISGYTDGVEIDGFNFRVNYDPAELLVIQTIVNDSPGADENWLRKNPQDGVGGGGILTDFTTNIAGEVRISVADLRLFSTRGTLASAGFSCRVDFQVIGAGSGLVTPSPVPGGTVLFDRDLSPAGVPSFTGTNIPPVTYALSIDRSGSDVRISWPSSSTGFVLEENAVLGTSNWTAISPMPADDGTNKSITVRSPTGKNFYRLRKAQASDNP
jgi:hypothetical protein